MRRRVTKVPRAAALRSWSKDEVDDGGGSDGVDCGWMVALLSSLFSYSWHFKPLDGPLNGAERPLSGNGSVMVVMCVVASVG